MCFPDPAVGTAKLDGVSVLPLERLLELKLASGMSAPHRMKDLSDVIELIRTIDLDEHFATALAPSVQEKYRELWRATRSADSDEPKYASLERARLFARSHDLTLPKRHRHGALDLGRLVDDGGMRESDSYGATA